MATKKRYCTECGLDLVETRVGAEKYDYDFGFKPYGKYNSTNGQRQYVAKYSCPESRWWNNHTSYMSDEELFY